MAPVEILVMWDREGNLELQDQRVTGEEQDSATQAHADPRVIVVIKATQDLRELGVNTDRREPQVLRALVETRVIQDLLESPDREHPKENQESREIPALKEIPA